MQPPARPHAETLAPVLLAGSDDADDPTPLDMESGTVEMPSLPELPEELLTQVAADIAREEVERYVTTLCDDGKLMRSDGLLYIVD